MRRVLIGAALLALVLGAPALAARRPTRTERAAILAALHRAHVTTALLRIRVATVTPGWAEASLGPRGARAAILRRRAGRWRVALVGGAGIGCHVPYDVRRDLHLIC